MFHALSFWGVQLVLLLVWVCCTGCARLWCETLEHLEPPSRIFCGVRRNLQDLTGDKPSTTFFFLADLPFEVVADVVMLPMDIAVYAEYCMNPPLSLLVEKNDLKKLEARLKHGAAPNEKDWRYYGSPLMNASKYRNIEAVKLLLKYGAKPEHVSYFKYYSDAFCQEEAYLYLRHGVPDGFASNLEAVIYVREWIEAWLSLYKSSKYKSSDEKIKENNKRRQQHFEIIKMLLDNHFPTNSIWRNYHEGETQRTALDLVLLDKNLPLHEKETMVALLRSHGAKEYTELAQENPNLPHLDKAGLTIPLAFAPVVNILEHSYEAAGYRLSKGFPGVNGESLVIDYLPIKELLAKKPYFVTIMGHRRKSPTEWNQELESFEVPAYFRAVLTEKDNKVPTQLDGVPLERVFYEQWFSLPTCELYLQFHPRTFSRGVRDNVELRDIVLMRYPKGTNFDSLSTDEIPYSVQSLDENTFKEILWYVKEDNSDEPSEEEKAFLERAIKKTAEFGLSGHWERLPKRKLDHRGYNLPITYVFSTHRSLEELRKTPSPVAPYPDEVLIILPFVQLPSADAPQYISNGRFQPRSLRPSEREYWNHSRAFLFFKREGLGGWGMDVTIMHGDEAVKQKTFSSIKPLLKAIYEPEEAK